jgi:amidase
LEKYLSERNAPYKTLADLIKFNEENAEKGNAVFQTGNFRDGGEKRQSANARLPPGSAKSKTLTQAQGIDAAMTNNKLDAIAAPSNAPVWTTDLINGDCSSGYVSSSELAAVAGLPEHHRSGGICKRLPIGISFFGTRLQRADFDKNRLRFRASDAGAKNAKVFATYHKI